MSLLPTRRAAISLAAFCVSTFCGTSLHALEVGDLECEARSAPLGIDPPRPRLGWVCASATRGDRQTAYQILVATSSTLLAQDNGDLWDSGKVVSHSQVDVPYAGPALQTGQQVFWKVRVWDAADQASAWSTPSSWTMGILNAGDWQALWIGESSSGRTPKTLGYHAAETTSPTEQKWVRIDLGSSRPLQAVRLYPKLHATQAGFGFPLRFKIEASDDPAFATATVIADRTAADFPNPSTTPVSFDTAVTARYVRVSATKLAPHPNGVNYAFALRQLVVLSGGVNVALDAPVTAKDSAEYGGWGAAGLTDGYLAPSGDINTAAYGLLLRREFRVNANLKRAVFFGTGLGNYTLSVNGSKVSENLLEPGWTEYTKTILYQTYDITALLRADADNALGLSLAHGLYDITAAADNRYVKFRKSFGPLKAIAQVRLEYADGSTATLLTDSTWKTCPGPITYENLFAGEDYDARKEIAGWDQPGTALDFQWQNAAALSGPGGALYGLSRAAPPIRTHEVLPPAAIRTLTPTIAVYDMGQNASLMPRLVASGPAGSSVRIIPAELVNAQGYADRASATQDGVRPAWWQYTLRGSGAESWTPQFFYQGSRHFQVELIPAQPGGALPVVQSLEALVVHADSPVTGSFETSSPLFNAIWKLVRWAQRSNMVSVMTDCPHREKMPWLEQNQLNGPSLRYNFDMRALQAKVTNDMADAQLANGFVPNIAPEFFQAHTSISNGFRNSPEWGGAVVLVPWQQYLFTGDTHLLQTHYEAMKAYVAFLASTASNHIVPTGLGDWYDVGPNPAWGSQLTPANLTATAHYFYYNRILSRVAHVLGVSAEGAHYAQRAELIRAAFNTTFFNAATGTYSTGSQTANAMPLAMGIPDAQHRAGLLAAIIADIRLRGNALSSGEVGHRYLLRALSDAGRSDVVFAMHSQSDKPGYGMQIARGATALTEKWDAGVGNFGSQNHFMQGHIVEWFFHDLAGIQPDETTPGFRHIVLKPRPCGGLTSCRADYRSVLGPIRSEWTVTGSTMTTRVDIPPGATATVHVPAAGSAFVLEGGMAADTAPGVSFLRMENGAAVYSVVSGSYHFTSTPALAAPGFVSIAVGSGQTTLTWQATPFATAYRILRASTPGGPYTTLASNVTNTSFTDTGLVNGTGYHYAIAALNDASVSALSEEVSATPIAIANAGFEAPATSTFAYNPGGGVWTFTAQSGSNGSGVAKNGSLFTSANAAAPEGTQVAFLQGTGAVSQLLTGLAPGVKYHLIFAAAQRAGGASWNVNGQTWNLTVDGATVASFSPGQTANTYANYHASFTATTTSHRIAFVGTNTRGGDNTVFLDNVRIARDTPAALANPDFETPAVSMFQYNPAGASWAFSPQSGSNGSGIARNASPFTTNNPPAPEGVQVAFLQGTGAITQTLAGLVPGMRYHLLFSSAQRAVFVNGGQTWNVALDGAPIAAYKPGATATAYLGYAASFTATAATHTLALVATNTFGGDNTALIDHLRLIAGAPYAPVGLSAAFGHKQVFLEWPAASGATGYRITRSSAGGANTVFTVSAAQTTFLDVDLTNGVAYDYRLAAVDESGVGLASAAVSATPLAPPVSEAERTAPRIELHPGENLVTITVLSSVLGHFYRLEFRDDLILGEWQPVPGLAAQEGTGGNLDFVAPYETDRRFFRVSIKT